VPSPIAQARSSTTGTATRAGPSSWSPRPSPSPDRRPRRGPAPPPPPRPGRRGRWARPARLPPGARPAPGRPRPAAGRVSGRGWSTCPRRRPSTPRPWSWPTPRCRRTSGSAPTAGRPWGGRRADVRGGPAGSAGGAATPTTSVPSCRPASWWQASTRWWGRWPTAGWGGSTWSRTRPSTTGGRYSRACSIRATRRPWPWPWPSGRSWPRSSTRRSSRSTTSCPTGAPATSSWSTWAGRRSSRSSSGGGRPTAARSTPCPWTRPSPTSTPSFPPWPTCTGGGWSTTTSSPTT
jgi:translation initiation factor IF-2